MQFFIFIESIFVSTIRKLFYQIKLTISQNYFFTLQQTNKIIVQTMKKDRYSVDLTNVSKYNYQLYDTNSHQVRSSFDKKIGATRMSQSILIANKIKSSSSFILDTRQKKTPYSTSKYKSNNSQLQLKLPTIKKMSFYQNPQQIQRRLSSPRKVLKKISIKNIYYQSLVQKSHKESSSINNYLLTLANNHFMQTIQALKVGRHIRVSQPTKQIVLKKRNPKLKTVFLDLDETLVHCDENASTYTVKLDFPIEGGHIISAGVRVRPYCKQFLEQLANIAQVIIFTASSESYANVILKYLDPNNKIFSHKLYRHHCTQHKDYYVKDLKLVNRRLEDSVIVDNSAYCFMLQPYNGIPIIPYYHYGKDKQLMNLLPFLKQVLKTEDVRVPIKDTFFWHKYFQNDNDPKRIFENNFVEPLQEERKGD